MLLTREERGIRLMMGELKEYLKEKRLKVNAGKSKIMRFGKRVKRGKKESDSEEGMR